MTLHALARAPDPTVFRGIIFAGTPFHGCVNVLGPIKKGDSVLVNREICSPSVVFCWSLPLSPHHTQTNASSPQPCDQASTSSLRQDSASRHPAENLSHSTSSPSKPGPTTTSPPSPPGSSNPTAPPRSSIGVNLARTQRPRTTSLEEDLNRTSGTQD